MNIDAARLAFFVIPALLAATLVYGVRRTSGPRAAVITAAVIAAWMVATWLAADLGVLRRWEATPPPFMLLVLGIVLLALWIAFGPYGLRLARGVPLWTLVAVQAFRLPLELALHAMYARGVMPVQMSYEGRNYDILTGITALIVAAIVKFGGKGRVLAAVWNVFGLALLVNIVSIALLSIPRFAYFGPDRLNEWVADPPYVWLPAVMVLAALAGHLLIFRALRREGDRPPR
jgi:hypothetical protein